MATNLEGATNQEFNEQDWLFMLRTEDGGGSTSELNYLVNGKDWDRLLRDRESWRDRDLVCRQTLSSRLKPRNTTSSTPPL